MKSIQISKFNEKCIAIIDELNKTHESVLITRRGKPIARVIPAEESKPKRKFGKMESTLVIKKDIVNFEFTEDWAGIRSSRTLS